MSWVGFTLVLLFFLQVFVVLSSGNWGNRIYEQLVIERLVNQAPMAFIGLVVMAMSFRLNRTVNRLFPFKWFVCGLSLIIALAMFSLVPIGLSGNRILSEEADQLLTQKRDQLAIARKQSQNDIVLLSLGEDLAQAGRLKLDASDLEKRRAAKDFIDQQLGQMVDQIQQAELQSALATKQRTIGGTYSIVVLCVGFMLLALTALL